MNTENSTNTPLTNHNQDGIHPDIAQYQSEFPNLTQLRFTKKIEAAYSRYINQNYIKSDKYVMITGAFIYALFVVGDFFLLSAPLSYLAAAIRMCIVLYMVFITYGIFFKQYQWFRQHAFHLVATTVLLAGIHPVIISSLSSYPNDYQYLVGIIAILSTLPVVLRLHTRLCGLVNLLVCLAVIFYLFFVPADRTMTSEWEGINRLLFYFPYCFAGFLLGLGMTGTYLSYFFERLKRRQWLEKRISQIESNSLKELTQKFKRISQQDELTQIANRRYFYEQAIALMTTSQQQSSPLTLIIFDVDFFKKYNDHYGHIEGDACLLEIAQQVNSSCITAQDVFARYGGEEFVVLLPDTDETAALKRAEHLRKSINALSIPHAASPFGHITISVGITSMQCDTHTQLNDMLHQADQALYQAKEHGRNQAVLAAHNDQFKSNATIKHTYSI